MPSISVVMPVYNGMRYIRQAIDSVLGQVEADWELIVGDDGSTDGTREYLTGLQDPRVQVHLRNQDRGIFQNLNALVRHASSPVTQLLCQDDHFVDPNSLGSIVAAWRNLPAEVGAMRFNWGTDLGRCRLRAFADKVVPLDLPSDAADVLFFLFGCIPGNLSNVSVRTELVARTGWFSEALPYASDFEFWIRLCRQTTMRLDRRCLVHVRNHPEQASVTLNRHGELIDQLNSIVTPLYKGLVRRGYPEHLLRLHAILNYDSLQRDLAVKALIGHGETAFLHRVESSSARTEYTYGKFSNWAIWLISLGGRVLRYSVAKKLLATAARLEGSIRMPSAGTISAE